jgi:hypothetical protein
MHKSAMKCNETIGKWCKNKHGASKIIDTFETYHGFIYKAGKSLFYGKQSTGRAGAECFGLEALSLFRFWRCNHLFV